MRLSGRTATVLAPAKVNLTLRIVGRRRDGYHLLESIIAPVSLFDRVGIGISRRRSRQARVTCRVRGPERVAGGTANLAAQAALAVLRALDDGRGAGTGLEGLRVEIELWKRIPAGAGLGGGSSDAAAVLRALPSLLGRRLPAARLRELALELGADVPFFLGSAPALAHGIGERLQALAAFPRPALLLVVPRARVDTGWAYANALKNLTFAPSDHRQLLSRLRREPLERLLHNDFETGVERLVPDVGRLKRRLHEFGATATVMSGSGSGVLGLFASRAESRAAAAHFRLPDRAWAVDVLARRPRSVVEGR